MFNTDLTNDETKAVIDNIKYLESQFGASGPIGYFELGVFQGGTLRKVLENTKAECYGIDLFEDFVPSADNTHVSGTISKNALERALIDLNLINFKLFKNQTSIVTSLPKYEYSLYFIDANHTYTACLYDLMNCFHHMDKGFIVLHNANVLWEPDSTYHRNDGGPVLVVNNLNKLLANSSPGFSSMTKNLKFKGLFDRSAVYGNI